MLALADAFDISQHELGMGGFPVLSWKLQGSEACTGAIQRAQCAHPYTKILSALLGVGRAWVGVVLGCMKH